MTNPSCSSFSLLFTQSYQQHLIILFPLHAVLWLFGALSLSREVGVGKLLTTLHPPPDECPTAVSAWVEVESWLSMLGVHSFMGRNGDPGLQSTHPTTSERDSRPGPKPGWQVEPTVWPKGRLQTAKRVFNSFLHLEILRTNQHYFESSPTCSFKSEFIPVQGHFHSCGISKCP